VGRTQTLLIAVMFACVCLHGTVSGIAHLARSSVEAHASAGDDGDSDGEEGDEGLDEECPPESGLDEDDAKHTSSLAALTIHPGAPGSAAMHADELAPEDDHLDTLERPPRA
jgi:hypothetical protein